MTDLNTGGNAEVLSSSARPTAEASARLARWPYEPDVTQIVLLDHQMVPTPAAIDHWVATALDADPTVRSVRTGAMFPAAAAAFLRTGFHTIDTLALLDARLDAAPKGRSSNERGRRIRRSAGPRPIQSATSVHRLRAHHLPDVAALDRRAFGDPWGNDVRSLTDITAATPRHRARIVATASGSGIAGFAITGQSGMFGYLQRLAVDPDHRRLGIAQRLLDDSMRWMRRRGATTAMVNTAFDNAAALALYADAGFRRRPETLSILELSTRDLQRPASSARP